MIEICGNCAILCKSHCTGDQFADRIDHVGRENLRTNEIAEQSWSVMRRVAGSSVAVVLMGAAIFCCGGCQLSGPSIATIHSKASSQTYIVHLPGIAGETQFDHMWVAGLGSGGVADHLEIYDWTKPNIWIPALLAYAHNRSESRVIAAHIAAKLKADPNAHIILTAWSGGCQVAIWALEDLPPEAKIESLLLDAPSITPTYDLTRALSHVHNKMYVLTSPGDWFVLGVGTSLFGTSDGTRTLAAGLVGFTRPSSASVEQYRKIREMRYDSKWLRYGDLGGHSGAMGKDFAEFVLAPLLRADRDKASRTISPALAH